MKGRPGATLDESRGEISLTCDGFPFMLLDAAQAAALRDAIGKALDGDPDKTPPLGTRTPVTAITRRSPVQVAWQRFSGDLVHGVCCAAVDVEITGAAKSSDPACDCGLRSLILALEVS